MMSSTGLRHILLSLHHITPRTSLIILYNKLIPNTQPYTHTINTKTHHLYIREVASQSRMSFDIVFVVFNHEARNSIPYIMCVAQLSRIEVMKLIASMLDGYTITVELVAVSWHMQLL